MYIKDVLSVIRGDKVNIHSKKHFSPADRKHEMLSQFNDYPEWSFQNRPIRTFWSQDIIQVHSFCFTAHTHKNNELLKYEYTQVMNNVFFTFLGCHTQKKKQRKEAELYEAWNYPMLVIVRFTSLCVFQVYRRVRFSAPWEKSRSVQVVS